ncbi:unnamed protein product [Mesocestoides corti]|uniref:HMG box domain-containing protein n=1 Tax=Mesocestoides corti TaxID=53468 RepID=A0A0R3U917_MESCO|nr:unnamed protein product [Mesocestoides corti]
MEKKKTTQKVVAAEQPADDPNPHCVEVLGAFVKRLVSTNQMLTLSVAQLSALIDFELRELRSLYCELGFPPVPSDTTSEQWLLRIRGDKLPPAAQADRAESEEDDVAEEEEVGSPTDEATSQTLAKQSEQKFPPAVSPPAPTSIAPFAFFVRHVGETLRREHKARLGHSVSDAWLEEKLSAKWTSLSSEEREAWERAARLASHE